MRHNARQAGFSLTEVLMAVAILATGMLFVGGTFMLGVYYSTRATEQTIAAVVAEEAVNKIRLYGLDANDPGQVIRSTGLTRYVHDGGRKAVPVDQFRYPSAAVETFDKQYTWSALCRWTDPDVESHLLQVTVFVCRGLTAGDVLTPDRLEVRGVSGAGKEDQVQFVGGAAGQIYERSVLVDDATGQVYRIVEELAQEGTVRLNLDWQGGATGAVWAMRRPASGGRNPCVAVFQTEVRTPDRTAPAATAAGAAKTAAASSAVHLSQVR
jgi:prepilin-type N-terminal cleavage/methylation domain-containing protein